MKFCERNLFTYVCVEQVFWCGINLDRELNFASGIYLHIGTEYFLKLHLFMAFQRIVFISAEIFCVCNKHTEKHLAHGIKFPKRNTSLE